MEKVASNDDEVWFKFDGFVDDFSEGVVEVLSSSF
jgi:hypothetical protein